MTVTSAMVKELREKTGAGMMDCKRALQETENDFEKAVKSLREKGLAKAAKRSEREVSEGIIESYIHHSKKIGVIIELNCETDFVARNEQFQALAKDICMHIAASNPLFLDRETVSSELLEKEKEIYKQQAINDGKPEEIADKVAIGRVDKYYKEVCLLEQPFVKEPSKSIEELIKEKIGVIGENISVKRFCRFHIGE
ncbi:MAG: translation elongation factor Ts [Candidatus Margulisiibacteriota bacterium]